MDRYCEHNKENRPEFGSAFCKDCRIKALEAELKEARAEVKNQYSKMGDLIQVNQKWANIFYEFSEVYESGIFPDGDHINVSTGIWLSSIMEEIKLLADKGE